MKKYIGTKQIEAEPMTMGEAYRKGLIQIEREPTEKEEDSPGYHVKHEDGEGWSTSEQFEKVCRCADTFVDRLLIERDELNERLNKLRQFIESPNFVEIVTDEYQRLLLSKQESKMHEYLEILNERIKLLQQ